MTDIIKKLSPDFYSLGVGPPPNRLDAKGKAAWDELVALAPPGEWLRSDSIMLEILSNLLVQMRAEPTEEYLGMLAELLAKFLFGPDIMPTLGLEYDKPWPQV